MTQSFKQFPVQPRVLVDPETGDPITVFQVALAENTEVLSVIKGSRQDLRGLHAARPDADAVDEGTTYWSVNEPSAPGTIYVSDGANWTVVAAL